MDQDVYARGGTTPSMLWVNWTASSDCHCNPPLAKKTSLTGCFSSHHSISPDLKIRSGAQGLVAAKGRVTGVLAGVSIHSEWKQANA
jgi:hypothetical protein